MNRQQHRQVCRRLGDLDATDGIDEDILVEGRDARILADAGFSLDSVTPIDQFLWSSHVELVAVFSR